MVNFWTALESGGARGSSGAICDHLLSVLVSRSESTASRAARKRSEISVHAEAGASGGTTDVRAFEEARNGQFGLLYLDDVGAQQECELSGVSDQGEAGLQLV